MLIAAEYHRLTTHKVTPGKAKMIAQLNLFASGFLFVDEQTNTKDKAGKKLAHQFLKKS